MPVISGRRPLLVRRGKVKKIRRVKAKFNTRLGKLKNALALIGILPAQNKYADYTDQFTIGTLNITGASLPAPFATAYSVYAVNVVRIGAGDQVDDRNSNDIVLRRLSVRILLQPSLVTATPPNYTPPYQVRIMFVQDTQTVGDQNILPTPLTLLLQQVGNDYMALLSHLNVTSTRGRFKVLHDKVYRFSGQMYPNDATSTFQQFALKDMVIKKEIHWPQGLVVGYNGDTASDIERNAIYMIAFSDNSQAAESPCAVSMIVRQVFKDNVTK